MLITPLRQLTGVRCPVDCLCMEVFVYVGFLDLINAPPFRLLKHRVRCCRGCCKGEDSRIGIWNL